MPRNSAQSKRRTLPVKIATAAALMACAGVLLTAGAEPTGAAPRVAKSSAASAPATCGGQLVLKSDRTPWTCSFDDEFDATTHDATALDRAKWAPLVTATSGFHSGVECNFDSPNNVSVAEGTLRLTARKEASPFTCQNRSGSYSTQYSSGGVSTLGNFSQTYGRFEVRAKLPAARVKGLQESFWLWPVNPVRYGAYPYSGEIDIAEIYHQYPDRAIPYLHYVYSRQSVNPQTHANIATNNYCMIKNISAFHTYALEWTKSSMTISYDGVTCLIDNWVPSGGLAHPQPFDQPFFVVLTQALGIGTNAFDPARTPLPATTQVDYVRVWK